MKKIVHGKIIKKSGNKSYMLEADYIKLIPKINIKVVRQHKIMFHSEEDLILNKNATVLKVAPYSKRKTYKFQKYKN